MAGAAKATTVEVRKVEITKSSWSLARGWYRSCPLIVRFRQFPAEFSKLKYPVRLNVFWTMSNCSDAGLPLEPEALRLDLFEDRLVEAVEQDGQSVLSVVLTCNRKREFVFHTCNPQEFLSRLSAMPQEVDRYPIEIQSSSDVAWDYDDAVTRDFVSTPIQ